MEDKRFLVLGLGESGLAMAAWLARNGAKVRVADSRDDPPGRQELLRLAPQAELMCGAFHESLLQGVDAVALSPGLSINEPIVLAAQARGIEVTGEIELFAQALERLGWRAGSKVIAITGTNGKTTTTALTGELCRAAGLDVAVAGNISPAALKELSDRLDSGSKPDVWVLELSSFQLETTSSLDADVAAVLNVTDDHLDRHGDMSTYAAAKARIFAAARTRVINRDDKWVSAMAQEGAGVVRFGLGAPDTDESYGILEHEGEQWLARGTQALLPRASLALAGAHNASNALAALAMCEAIGLPRSALLTALMQFRGLSHRVELVAMRQDDVLFYDDSKGTNVGATLAALRGLGRKVVLIAGGDGKGQDFSPLKEAFAAHARAVVLIGRDAQTIAAQVAGCDVPLLQARDMDDAVIQADAHAQPGDAVMLSPACASFDMFRNYAHRAEVFVSAVLRLPKVSAR